MAHILTISEIHIGDTIISDSSHGFLRWYVTGKRDGRVFGLPDNIHTRGSVSSDGGDPFAEADLMVALIPYWHR